MPEITVITNREQASVLPRIGGVTPTGLPVVGPVPASSHRPSLAHALSSAFAPYQMSATTAQVLAASAQWVDIAPGRAVFHRDHAGEPVAWLLLQGQVCMGRLSTTGAPQLLRTVRAGQWVDAASIWLDGAVAALPQHDAWVPATAREVARLLLLRREAVLRVLADEPDLAPAWLGVIAAQVRALSVINDDLLHQDAEGRCAHWLLQLGPRQLAPEPQTPHGELPWTVELRDRKRNIAAELGITPETFSRVMRALSRKALIEVHGYSISVLDPEGLRRLASL